MDMRLYRTLPYRPRIRFFVFAGHKLNHFYNTLWVLLCHRLVDKYALNILHRFPIPVKIPEVVVITIQRMGYQ